jgi:hypothetical protein
MVMRCLLGFDGDRSSADRHGDADGYSAMRLPQRGQAIGKLPKRRFSRQRKGEGAALELGDHSMLRRGDGAAAFHGFFSPVCVLGERSRDPFHKWITTPSIPGPQIDRWVFISDNHFST